MTLYLVENSNGGTLGGFKRLDDAEACKRVWERRYESSSLVNGVSVRIREVKYAQAH